MLNRIETLRLKYDVNQKLLKMIKQVKERLRTTLKMIFIVQQKKKLFIKFLIKNANMRCNCRIEFIF